MCARPAAALLPPPPPPACSCQRSTGPNAHHVRRKRSGKTCLRTCDGHPRLAAAHYPPPPSRAALPPPPQPSSSACALGPVQFSLQCALHPSKPRKQRGLLWSALAFLAPLLSSHRIAAHLEPLHQGSSGASRVRVSGRRASPPLPPSLHSPRLRRATVDVTIGRHERRFDRGSSCADTLQRRRRHRCAPPRLRPHASIFLPRPCSLAAAAAEVAPSAPAAAAAAAAQPLCAAVGSHAVAGAAGGAAEELGRHQAR